MNIYDIAGNVEEWTLGKTSYADAPCADRGGDFGGTGSDCPASCRYVGSTDDSYDVIGFRVSLF